MNTDDIVEGIFTNGGKQYVILRGSDIPLRTSENDLDHLDYLNCLKGEFEHSTAGENIIGFDYGPSMGGVIESILFKMYTNGERIISMSTFPRFKERILNIRGEAIDRALLKMERFNGFHSASYSTLFCRAIEKSLNIKTAQSTKLTRVIMVELERIASHLFVITRLCEAASQNIAAFHLNALRERMLRLISKAFGHRYFFGINTIGGITREIRIDLLSEELPEIVKEFKDILRLLSGSRIFIDRIQKTCTIERPWLCGPALRATGVSYDVRGNDPYYEGLKFNVVSENGSDSLARFLVRAQEISESERIIEQAINSMEITENLTVKPDELTGRSLNRIETPSGDCTLYIEIKDGNIDYVYVRPPSLVNLEGFLLGMQGNVKTDFPFAYESFGIWISEMSVIS